jgi:mono/diheme cytochrome c family protein
MKPEGWIFLCVFAALPPQAALAQHAAGGAPLSDTQKSGQLLYEQSCGICHSKPTLTSPVFGPKLSQETLEGREELIQAFIANGSARMPGFKVMYKPNQIAAIASYLKTVPKPPPEAAADDSNAPRVQD